METIPGDSSGVSATKFVEHAELAQERVDLGRQGFAVAFGIEGGGFEKANFPAAARQAQRCGCAGGTSAHDRRIEGLRHLSIIMAATVTASRSRLGLVRPQAGEAGATAWPDEGKHTTCFGGAGGFACASGLFRSFSRSRL